MLKLRKLTDSQRNQYIARIGQVLADADDSREAASAALSELHDKAMEEASRGVDPEDHELVLLALDFYKLNDVALFTLYPYKADYEDGVEPPRGGPFDWTLEERWRRFPRWWGQIPVEGFSGNRKKVTVSVEGFPEPVKLRTTVGGAYSHRYLLGTLVMGDERWTFSPPTGAYGLIDESKAWEQVGSSRKLYPWEIKKEAVRLTRAEREHLDGVVLEAVRAHDDAFPLTRYDLQRSWSFFHDGQPFEWPDDPSSAAKAARDEEGIFTRKAIQNALNRLLRRGVIERYSSPGKPTTYWAV